MPVASHALNLDHLKQKVFFFLLLSNVRNSRKVWHNPLINETKDDSKLAHGIQRRSLLSVLLPKHVVVFMWTVELQFKSRQQILNHDVQCVIQHP